MYTIVGLGNPGTEYEKTRHNTGRMIVDALRQSYNFPEWKYDATLKVLLSVGVVGKEKIELVLPETFMNKSGQSILSRIGVVGTTSKKEGSGPVSAPAGKKAEQLVVIYDDLDLPLGSIKISFKRSSGGHRGVESIIKALKSEAFVRIRIGISPKTPTGKMKKPRGDAVVQDFILGVFKDAEMVEIKKVGKRVGEAVEILLSLGSSSKMVRTAREKAMGEFNAG